MRVRGGHGFFARRKRRESGFRRGADGGFVGGRGKEVAQILRISAGKKDMQKTSSSHQEKGRFRNFSMLIYRKTEMMGK